MPSNFDGRNAQTLESYPGLGVLYEANQNPFFKKIIETNLLHLSTKTVGISLLGKIQNSRPQYRHNFPAGINVIFTPLKVRFVEGGFKLQMGYLSPEHGLSGQPPVPLGMTRDVKNSRIQDFKEKAFGIKKEAGLPMTTSGLGVLHESMHQTHASDGTGSVCIVEFNNARVPLKDRPYIYLAHELIHCLHSLTGTKHVQNDEPATVGLGQHANDALTENRFLEAFGLPRRTHY